MGAIFGLESIAGRLILIFFPNFQKGKYDKVFDSEVFVLENIAQRLSPDSKGVFNLVSERVPCLSCTSVIDQFRKMFPNIKLNVRGGSRK